MMGHVSSCILFLHSLSVVHIHPDEMNLVRIILTWSASSVVSCGLVLGAGKRSLLGVDRAFHYALYEADSGRISLGSIALFTVPDTGTRWNLCPRRGLGPILVS
jgi:hypothetical protein